MSTDRKLGLSTQWASDFTNNFICIRCPSYQGASWQSFTLAKISRYFQFDHVSVVAGYLKSRWTRLRCQDGYRQLLSTPLRPTRHLIHSPLFHPKHMPKLDRVQTWLLLVQLEREFGCDAMESEKRIWWTYRWLLLAWMSWGTSLIYKPLSMWGCMSLLRFCKVYDNVELQVSNLYLQ